MKPDFNNLIPAFVALCLLSSSCTTAKKRNSDSGRGTDLLIAVPANESVSESTVEALKVIANSPAAMLPEKPATEESGPEIEEAKSLSSEIAAWEKWKSPGLNPQEINPGDIFSEHAGSVLKKSLSLADELPSGERRTLLNHFTTIATTRVPVTFSRKEITELQSRAGENVPLPTRSVAFDYRSETRVVALDRIETLFSHLSRGESGGVIESKERQVRLMKQLASVRKELEAGKRLFIVTATIESEKLSASYPGAPIGEKDVELVRNALQTQYPHLESLEATKQDDKILITGSPRIIWKFESREVKLNGDHIVIDFESIVQL